MATNALYEKGREGFLDGSIDWDTHDISVVLVDLDDYAKLITNATNATPIVVTSATHGFTSGDIVAITGVGGNTNANGIFKIANAATNTFELTGGTACNYGTNIAGNGAYTSGGYAVNLTVDDNLDDIPAGARVATSTPLTRKTVTLGVADAADVTFSTVTGDASEALVIYKDTATASSSRLIAFIASATGLPVTPNGGDITVAWSNAAEKIFRL